MSESKMPFDGGPAYPTDDYSGYSVSFDEAKGMYKHEGNHPGMSLRDYFAGQALAGFSVSLWDEINGVSLEDMPQPYLSIAKYVYTLADAMIAERAKAIP